MWSNFEKKNKNKIENAHLVSVASPALGQLTSKKLPTFYKWLEQFWMKRRERARALCVSQYQVLNEVSLFSVLQTCTCHQIHSDSWTTHRKIQWWIQFSSCSAEVNCLRHLFSYSWQFHAVSAGRLIFKKNPSFNCLALLVPLYTGAVLSKTDDQEKYDPQFAITY